MRFWLLHSADVPLQDQIVAQVSLGILSAELAPGERLPSVRELARRFHIHANTVSLAYRRLERDGWLQSRRGSGIYVRTEHPTQTSTPQSLLHTPIQALVRTARALGVTPQELHRRLDLALTAPTSVLLLEPDPALARIVLAELTPHLHLPIATAPIHPLLAVPAGTLVCVLPSKAAALRAALPTESPLHILRVRSVPQSLAPWLPAPADSLIAIASHWPPFLDFARTMLIAAGFHADALLLRNANEPAWQNGLTQSAAVVCDTHTATLLPKFLNQIPFAVLADEAIGELKLLTDHS